jgi:hypothetical protein
VTESHHVPAEAPARRATTNSSLEGFMVLYTVP